MARTAKTDEEKALAVILANPELFGLDAEKVSEVQEKFSARAMHRIVSRKFGENGTEENVDMFVETATSLAAQMFDSITPSGTSGNRRIGVPTEFGQFTLVLGDE